jgi:hypothetical protein
MHQIQPSVGQWYLRGETGLKFEVIDIDDGDGMIEIQDEDGALDEIDSEAWFATDIEIIDQPKDFTAAFDNVAEPDEADGGDPVDVDGSGTETQRVATDELLSDSTDDDEWDDEPGSSPSEESDRTRKRH